jgi:hypothetical protein
MASIKFQKFYVTDGAVKARVSYSEGQIYANVKAGAAGGLLGCVTLYAQDYSDALGRVLPEQYKNDTDSQSHYFDKGRARFFPGDPLYAAALERCRQNAADDAAKQAIRAAKRSAAGAGVVA